MEKAFQGGGSIQYLQEINCLKWSTLSNSLVKKRSENYELHSKDFGEPEKNEFQ